VVQGRSQEARDALEASRRIAEQSKDAELLCTALSHLGDLDLRQDRFAEGRTNLEKALALQRQAADEQGAAVTLSNLGVARLKSGDLDGSWKIEEEALALFRARLPAYGEADLRVDVGPQETAEEVAARVAVWLQQAGSLSRLPGEG